MLKEERRRRRELESAAVALLLFLGKRKRIDPLGETTIVVTLRNAIVRGDIASFKAGVKAAGRDIKWLAKVTGEDIPIVVPRLSLPEAIERATGPAKGYGKAVGESIESPDVAKAPNPTKTAFDENAWRLDRTATTKNTTTFNDARSETVRKSAEKAGVQVYEVWDATLDKRVCPVCEALDGTYADERGEWEGGASPGHVHPGCRCVSSWVTRK